MLGYKKCAVMFTMLSMCTLLIALGLHGCSRKTRLGIAVPIPGLPGVSEVYIEFGGQESTLNVDTNELVRQPISTDATPQTIGKPKKTINGYCVDVYFEGKVYCVPFQTDDVIKKGTKVQRSSISPAAHGREHSASTR